jgi:hypothetical protein
MENNEHPDNPRVIPEQNQPQTVYPAPTTGPLVNSPQPVAVVSQENASHNASITYSPISIVILILLLLTFFSPLGSVLFLPIVLIGLFSAARHMHTTTKPSYQSSGPQSFIFSLIKAVVVIGMVIVVGILGLIGLFFILLATGHVDLRMGS